MKCCIGLLHGYSLEGSGSNIWTRYMIQALCREGEIVHLVCQEKSPEKYDFIAEAYHYDDHGVGEKLFSRDVPYSGRCIFHRPQSGKVLPVFVGRFLESKPPMLPMNELPDEVVQDYLDRNYKIIREIVKKHGISVVHANHAVLMSVVAQRCRDELSTPYAIMPHGSDIEYVIKKDARFLVLATEAIRKAGLIFVLSRELSERIVTVFSELPVLEKKMIQLNLGVDTALFEAVERSLRQSRIQQLLAGIASAPPGRTMEITKQMLAAFHPQMSLPEMKNLLNGICVYPARQPDEDLDEKLNLVDWENDRIILSAGRLISGKGIQLLIASLPLIFEAHPESRLLVAGHGPLREGMEMFLWALEHGETALVEKLILWGTELEGGEAKPFQHLQKFYEAMRNKGKLDDYFSIARRTIHRDRVIFTGYLKHEQLRHLFSCSDVAVFPSIVPEAGPLVFLEAMAAGCFPIATYFGGARNHIDLIAGQIESSSASELMKIRPEEDSSISDIVHHVSAALELQGKYQQNLRKIAVENYDWRSVARQWKDQLSSLAGKNQ